MIQKPHIYQTEWKLIISAMLDFHFLKVHYEEKHREVIDKAIEQSQTIRVLANEFNGKLNKK